MYLLCATAGSLEIDHARTHTCNAHTRMAQCMACVHHACMRRHACMPCTHVMNTHHATPCHTTPRHTMPHHATPCHTTLHHATLRHATPRHAMHACHTATRAAPCTSATHARTRWDRTCPYIHLCKCLYTCPCTCSYACPYTCLFIHNGNTHHLRRSGPAFVGAWDRPTDWRRTDSIWDCQDRNCHSSWSTANPNSQSTASHYSVQQSVNSQPLLSPTVGPSVSR